MIFYHKIWLFSINESYIKKICKKIYIYDIISPNLRIKIVLQKGANNEEGKHKKNNKKFYCICWANFLNTLGNIKRPKHYRDIRCIKQCYNEICIYRNCLYGSIFSFRRSKYKKNIKSTRGKNNIYSMHQILTYRVLF